VRLRPAIALMVLAASCTSTGATPAHTPLAVSSATPSSAAPRSPGVVEIAAMSTPRAAHTATALRDGTVLIAGGFGDHGGAEATAELFDPTTGRFRTTGSMSTGRYADTATRLRDGRVLIAGGYDADGHRLPTAELYDPGTGRFTATGSMIGPRADHTATLLADGRVLIAGGTGPGWSFLSSAELFDPGTGTFTATGSMSVPRESATATRLMDGRVLVAGGHAGRHEDITIYASAEAYDPSTGRFAPVGSMSVPRHKHDAVRLKDGRVLVIGGADQRDDAGRYDSTELFDPATNAFSPAGDLHDPRYKMRDTSVLLADGRALVCCGAPAAELFDPASGGFTTLAGGLGTGPLFAAAARVGPREVLVTGGYSLSGPATADAWLIHE
jgi:hypothetical protein